MNIGTIFGSLIIAIVVAFVVCVVLDIVGTSTVRGVIYLMQKMRVVSRRKHDEDQ